MAKIITREWTNRGRPDAATLCVVGIPSVERFYGVLPEFVRAR
jgi:hypothetical protein